MANLYFQILDNSSIKDQRLDIINAGADTLILGGYARDNSFEFADVYTVTVNSINTTAKTLSINLTAETLHNPFVNSNIADVMADGTTYNVTVIPGFALLFDDAENISVSQQSVVTIGDKFIDQTITAGDSDDSDNTVDMIGVLNLWSATLSGCKATIIAKPRPRNVSGSSIIAARCDLQWGSDTVEYQLTFDSYAPGSNQVCQIDGGNDVTIYCDGTTETQILPGLYIVFNDSVLISSTNVAIIRVSDGYKYVQLAQDDNGIPGTWVTGGPATIIQSGQSVDGMIESGGTGYVWKRLVPESFVNPSDNPREYEFLVQGDITS
jgi:hypothetical protein